MKNKWCVNVVFLFFLVGICVCACTQDSNSSNNSRWTEEKIQEWYDNQPWLVGCNYIPATAINQIEMWSADTFDPEQIDKELSWAHELGFNTLRVFLSSVVWQNDAAGMKKRMDDFLNIQFALCLCFLMTVGIRSRLMASNRNRRRVYIIPAGCRTLRVVCVKTH